MNNTITFRLKGGKTPTSWSIKRAMAVKEGEGQKYIAYYPGSNSIWEEDNKKNDIKPETVYFEYNDILSDPATEIVVPVTNKVLIDYLKTHPYFGVHYDIYSKEEVAKEKVKSYDDIERALSYIKETNSFKIQAMALAIIGEGAYGKTVAECSAALKERAVDNATQVIERFEADNYESKYLAALAFFSGIIRENNLNNAVVWNDADQGVILHLAKGEKGINKLAELLSVNTNESRLILQEIGVRLDKNNITKPSKTTDELAELTALYKEKFDKNVPFSKAKDLDWIKEKLNS